MADAVIHTGDKVEAFEVFKNQPGVSDLIGFGNSLTPDAFNQMIMDSSSFTVTLDSPARSAIQWIVAKDRILIGTSDEEWRMSGHSNKPLTPTNFDLKPQTRRGSKSMQPLVLQESILFVDFVGKALRKMTWDGIDEVYRTPDLLLLAEHLTKSGGITTMAYQRNPSTIIWATLSNGDLISCSYVKDQDVIAWAVHPLGTQTAIDADSEVEEITYTDYTQYFIGSFFETPSTYNVLVNGIDDSTIDTTWGDSGYWGIDTKTTKPYDSFQLTDGRILVSFNSFVSGSNTAYLAMVDTDGVLDTTWGTDGYFVLPTASASWRWFNKILQDNDGDFHLFGSRTGIGWTGYVKISGEGEFISTSPPDQYQAFPFVDAVWSDSTKTRILAINITDTAIVTGAGNVQANIMAIDPSTGLRDLTWPGNLGYAGFANFGGGYKIKRLSDGYVTFQNGSPTMQKFLSNGTALDLSWASSGTLDIGAFAFEATANRITQDGDTLYTITVNTIGGDINNTISKIDSTGTVVIEKNIVTLSNKTYQCIQVFNDQLIIATNKQTGATNNVEFWTQDLVFTGEGFDITGIDFIYSVLPDEVTRNFTIDKTRVEGVGYANSVCVIPGATEDEIWITIERVINGSIVQYVERMAPRDWGSDQEDCFFVDSGLTYDGAATNNFTGLDHLEGETVAILGDGAVFTPQVVTNGTLPENLDQTVTKAQIGLPYTYTLKPMRFDQNVNGISKGSVKKISTVVISFYETLNARYGDGTTTRGIDWRKDEAYTTPPALYTGDKKVVADGGFSVEDPFEITGSDPLPCTVRAIIPDNEITGR